VASPPLPQPYPVKNMHLTPPPSPPGKGKLAVRWGGGVVVIRKKKGKERNNMKEDMGKCRLPFEQKKPGITVIICFAIIEHSSISNL
jgi:hypothetical protein